MSWKLTLDKEREWPAKRMVGSIEFREPTLRIMRTLPEIELIRTFPDRSSSYAVDWAAVEAWLKALVTDEVDSGLIDQLSPAEAERAKVVLLGFFNTAAAATPRSEPQTISASEPASAQTRID
jgi:phosphopantetheinyl transferase (holo-ACP synthase)